MPSSLSAHFIRHVELYLTAVGLLVILLVPSLFTTEQRLAVIAITAVGVGVVHGVLFWVVRRRQRLVRKALLQDVQGMLKDRINNKLQVVLVHTDAANRDLSPDDQAQLREVADSVKEVAALLDRLSLEALSAWQAHYSYKPSAP
jgi:hypothetical protein